MNSFKTTFGTAVAVATTLVAASAFAQTAQLHVVDEDTPQVYVQRTGTTANKVLFKLENNGRVRFEMKNGANSWTFDNNGNSFLITKAGSGGPVLFTLASNGNMTLAGTSTATQHVNSSSKEVKENFRPINEGEVLEKLVGLPVLEWKYKQDPAGENHVGPFAEDFQQAFGLNDGKHISTVDAAGVTMAAVKGLNSKLEGKIQEKDAEIARLRQTNEEFAERLAKLEEKLASK